MTRLAYLTRAATQRLRGLYAITGGDALGAERIAQAVTLAIEGGATLIQYRDKSTDVVQREAEVRVLLEICRSYQVPLIINDDVDLARAVGADGVHLGRDDAGVADARRTLGRNAIIGVSCYNLLARARAAEAAGADYVAFGRFFVSRTKPHAVMADLELLRSARAELRIPIVAIGGITHATGARLIEAGADMLAVVEGVFGADDIRGAAHRYAQLFEQQEKAS
ncbi:MAG: thiamine phosphate synthase [Gammaproteobacteria bacterium]|nr:thiamine phosphate synthase [Gammaproteobacteria bacterium]